FKGADFFGILTSLAVDHPTPPRQLNPAVPEPLSAFILHMLAKKAEDRPQTGEAVAEALGKLESTSGCAAMPAPTATVENDPWADIDATDPSLMARPVLSPAQPSAAEGRPRSSKKLLFAGLAGLFAIVAVGGILIATRNKDDRVAEKATAKADAA